jgi:hypothetical protein
MSFPRSLRFLSKIAVVFARSKPVDLALSFFLKNPGTYPSCNWYVFFLTLLRSFTRWSLCNFFNKKTLEVPCRFHPRKSRPNLNIGQPNLRSVGLDLRSRRELGLSCVRRRVSVTSGVGPWSCRKSRRRRPRGWPDPRLVAYPMYIITYVFTGRVQ